MYANLRPDGEVQVASYVTGEWYVSGDIPNPARDPSAFNLKPSTDTEVPKIEAPS